MIEDQKQKPSAEPAPPFAQPEPKPADEPFLIDPGSEDPGAGIDQLPPQPAPEEDR